MTHVLITVSGGIIDQVTFFDCRPKALRALASFVKGMNPEEEDAAVFDPKGLVVNAKNLLNEADQFIESSYLANEWVSDKETQSCIYLIGNPVHWLGFMVVSSDDPLGFENPIEAISELGQMRKSAGNHLKLYRVVPVEGPIITRAELEQYNAENENEDFVFPLVEEYLKD
ncbi:MAG: hypothetical protein ABSB22_23810 [Thermodesulfobacteriota bacterium]|jgi:hypothetical protein